MGYCYASSISSGSYQVPRKTGREHRLPSLSQELMWKTIFLLKSQDPAWTFVWLLWLLGFPAPDVDNGHLGLVFQFAEILKPSSPSRSPLRPQLEVLETPLPSCAYRMNLNRDSPHGPIKAFLSLWNQLRKQVHFLQHEI